MKIKILIILSILFMYGCGSKGFYILSTVQNPQTIYKSRYKSIGVEKITLPQYLFKREIAVAKSASQISFISGVWAEDLDSGLTNRVIGYLQKKFNIPNVKAYPWGTDKQPSLVVQIQITRFIAQGDSVYLYANWKVENTSSGKSISKLFNTKVPTDKNEANIVASMDRAFGELEDEIARGIRGF
ncbi:MAG: PqiC family protein [Sulfurovum sp.]